MKSLANLRTSLFICLFLFLASGFLGCGICNRISSPQDILPGTVSIKPPEVDRWKMDNGLEVVYYYRPELPLVSGALYLPKGSLSNDSGISELSGVMVQQMREGAIAELSPDNFDTLLDMKAAKIEASQDFEVTTVSFSSLSEDFEEIFSYFKRIVTAPVFNEGRLSLWKKLSKEGIRRRKDSPEVMASMLFTKLLYGENSPWYTPLSISSIDKISIDMMKRMHARLFVPEGAVLVLVGDLDGDKLKSEVENQFSGWKPLSGVKPLPRFTSFDQSYTPPRGIYVIESEFEQANIILGHKSLPRDSDTVFEEVFFNRVLGSSGFNSLLFKEIRERRGLVYSIRGGFDSSMIEGSFRVALGTRAESALNAFSTTYSLLKSVQEGYLPEEEVESSRVSITKSYVFKFEDPAYAARRPVLLDLYGFPKDYDTSFVDKINKISKEELLSYAENNLTPDAIFSVIVGKVNPEEVKSQVGDAFPVCRVSFDHEPHIESCW